MSIYYSDFKDLLENIDRAELLDLVNDESVDPGTIVLDESAQDFNSDAPAVKRIFDALNKATGEINGYTRKHYDDTPVLLNTICVDLTIYYLYQRRYRKDMPESLTDNLNARIKQLKDIQSGKILLEDSEDNRVSTTKIKTNKTVDDRIFGKDVWDKY